MKAVHSLWTKPPGFKLTRNTALLLAASAAFTNRSFEHTEFVTDDDGLKIAERLGLGFVNYRTALNDVCPPEMAHIWALGKIEAQATQSEPFVHIDNDLLLYHLPPRRFRNARVGAQSIDEPGGYQTDPETREIAYLLGHTQSTPLNTGVIVWNDLRLCQEYCSRAMYAARAVADKSSDGRAISLVIEQAVLGRMCTDLKVDFECLIPIATQSQPCDYDDCLFTHLWAGTKERERYARQVEMRFSREFPTKYREACRGFAFLLANGLAVL